MEGSAKLNPESCEQLALGRTGGIGRGLLRREEDAFDIVSNSYRDTPQHPTTPPAGLGLPFFPMPCQ